MYSQKKIKKSGNVSAIIYAPPDLQIVIFTPEDVITKSEIGGQWPWGEAQGTTFGE